MYIYIYIYIYINPLRIPERDPRAAICVYMYNVSTNKAYNCVKLKNQHNSKTMFKAFSIYCIYTYY